MKRTTLYLLLIIAHFLLQACEERGSQRHKVEDVRYPRPDVQLHFDDRMFRAELTFTKEEGFTYQRIIRTTDATCDPASPEQCAHFAELAVENLPVYDTPSLNTNYYYILAYYRNSDYAYNEDYWLYQWVTLNADTLTNSLVQYATYTAQADNTNDTARITFTNVHDRLNYKVFRSSQIDCDWDNYSLCDNPQLYTAHEIRDPLSEPHHFYYLVQVSYEGFSYAQTETLAWKPQSNGWTQTTTSPGWINLSQHASTQFNNKIFVLGGLQGHTSSESNNIYVSGDGSNWDLTRDAPEFAALSKHAAATFDGKLWIAGGSVSGTSTNSLFYSEDGYTWKQATTPNWGARHSASLRVYNNKLWLIGGETFSNCYNDIWSSANGFAWSQMGSLPGEACSRIATLVFNNRLWILGGVTSEKKPVAEVWNTADGIDWAQAPIPTWPARSYHQATLYNGYIHLLGGADETNTPLRDVWISEDGKVWAKLTDTPAWSTAVGYTFETYLQRLYVIGADSTVWTTTGVHWNAGF